MKKVIITLFFGILINFSINAQDFSKYEHVVQIQTSAICKMCKDRIERDLGLTKGIQKADLNLDDKVVSVAYNPKKTNPEAIKLAISNIGYDADDIIADQKSHDRLPDCCQKTAPAHTD